MKGNVFGAVCLALGALTAQAERPAEPCDIRPIQRTMNALEESTAEKPAQIRVLFYGQSIVAQGWGNQIIADWRKRYPTAKISSACQAIGGYTSPELSRTAYADLYPYYPDILFFHVYGPLDKYEEIIRETRSRTTAEIVLWSSHMAAKDDPAAMLAAADERTKGIADIARRYNCTFVDLNRKWAKNLVDKGLEPKALLRDTIHLSKEAGALDLYAGFIAEELKFLPGCSGEKTSGTVETIGADDGRVVRKADGSVELSFTGNRVVGEVSVPGGAKVFLDGRPAEEVPEMWYMTRCSASPMWMPAVNRVQWKVCPVAEDWTLTYLEGSDPDGAPILFEAEGSVSGKCGRGSTAEDFLASNGRVFIEKGDFGSRQYRQFRKKVKVGQTVKWSARPQFALPCKADKAGQRLVLVQGCTVGRHVLRIVPEGGKGVAFASFTVHCPPDPAQFASATGDRSAATFIPSQRDMLENDPQAAAAKAAGERRLKVLAIGNSFSASMMREFPAAAAAYPGVKLAVANMMIGGCTLDRHWANVEKASDPGFRPYSISKNYAFDKEVAKRFPKTANIPEMLKADRWDVVTIQQGSSKSAFPETYEPYAGKLIAKIRELAPQAEIWIQETWSYAAYADNLAKWKMTPGTMHQALRGAYAGIAKKYGLKTIPTGDAVALYRERLPVDYGTLLTKDEIAALKPPATIDIHGDVAGSSSWQENGKLKRDFIHLNAEGRYLQGCVWLAALFDADLTRLTYEPGIKDFKGKAKLMRECAAEAVARSRQP